VSPQFVALMRCLEAALECLADRLGTDPEEVYHEVTITGDGGPYPVVTVNFGRIEVYLMHPKSVEPYAYWLNDFDEIEAENASAAAGEG
jgi:hypothetical protein